MSLPQPPARKPRTPFGTPKPLCACGCGEPVKKHGARWIGAHMPPAQRIATLASAAARQARRHPPKRCECGCERWLARPERQRWATPQCVPRAHRQAAARHSRERYRLRCDARRFGLYLDRLKQQGRRVTGGDLIAIFKDLAARYYNRGYNAAESKFRKRGRTAA